jgi:hypothetical protein
LHKFSKNKNNEGAMTLTSPIISRIQTIHRYHL